MEPTTRLVIPDEGQPYTPNFIDPVAFLRSWKNYNYEEYSRVLEHQAATRENSALEEERKRLQEEVDREYYAQTAVQKKDSRAIKYAADKNGTLEDQPTPQSTPNSKEPVTSGDAGLPV
jgi:ATPase subunit of ABC transporter with duplicated ATPase domains